MIDITNIKKNITWRYIALVVFSLIVYLILAMMSGRVLSADVQLPTLWFPAGFTLALVLLGGYRYLVVTVIGVIIISSLRGQPITLALFIAVSNTITIWGSVYLLLFVFKIDKRLQQVRDFIILIMVGGFGTMFIGTIFAIVTLMVTTSYTPMQLVKQFIVLWLGSSIATAIITPFILSWYNDRTYPSSRRQVYEMIGLLVFTHIVGWLAFSNVLQVQSAHHTIYLIAPSYIWVIIRFKLREVTLINVIFVGFVFWNTYSPEGLIYSLPISDQLIFTYSTIGIGSSLAIILKILIDERNAIELVLRKEHDDMTQVLDTLGQGVSVLNKEGLYEYVNPAFAKSIGYDYEEIIGTDPYRFIADSFKPELEEIVKLRQQGLASTYQITLKHKSGEDVQIMTTGVPRIINGEYHGSISVTTDIRPILEAQEAQRKSEAQYRQLFENVDVGMFRYTIDGELYAVNRRLATLVGYTSSQDLLDDVNNKVRQFYVMPDRRKQFYKLLEENGHIADYESEIYRFDGDGTIWISESAYAIYDNNDEVLYYEGTIIDITSRKLAEQDLKRSEEQFRQIFENSQIGMYRTTPDGKTLLVNPYMANLHGYDTPDMMLSDYSEDTPARYVNPLRRSEFAEILDREGQVTDFESAVYRSDIDDIIWISESAYAIRDEENNIIYYEGVLIDITRQKRYEQEVQRSEAFFRAIFEHSADSVIVVDTTSHIIMANRAHQQLVGYSADELKTMTVVNYVHPDDVAREEALFQNSLKNKEDSYHLKLRYICKDGTLRWIDASVGLVWDKDGQYQYAVGISRDITDARKTQLAIENSEKQFRAVFENARIPITITRDDRTIDMINPAFCEMLGYTPEELVQRKFDDISYPEDNIQNIELFQQLIHYQIDSFTLTKRYIHRDRSIIWANVSVSRFDGHVSDDSDNRIYTIAVAENITERKLAEERLLAEVRLNEQLIDALPGVFYLFNKSGRFLRWNKILEQVSGLTADDIQLIKPIDLLPLDNQEEFRQAITEVYEIGYTVIETSILHLDGHIIPYLMNGYLIRVEEEDCVLAIGIDISHLKATELALRESEERHRSLFENSLVGMFRTTLDGRFLSANPALIQMLGYDTAEELYKLNISTDLYADFNEREQHMKRVQVIDDIINEHTPRLKKKDGGIIITSVRVKTIRNTAGDIIYFEGSMIDITEKYHYDEAIKQLNVDLSQRIDEATQELRDKNKQLMELDRLRAKFIADMSHEMRTPLAVLNTRIYLLQHRKSADDLDRHIKGLQIQLERLEEFVENAFSLSLIDMSRQNIQFNPISLNDIVENVITALAPRAEVSGLTLSYEPDLTLPSIIGVEGHLSQVATNLVGNAIKYTKAGYVHVTTGMDNLTKHVYLRVEDSGMGIAPEDMQYLFSRFYRGERAGQSTIPGTGLGLSIVREIVDMHGGHIDIESTINEGTIFTVWLLLEPDNYQELNDATEGE